MTLLGLELILTWSGPYKNSNVTYEMISIQSYIVQVLVHFELQIKVKMSQNGWKTLEIAEID